MESNAQDVLLGLQRRCKECIAVVHATCQQRISEAVAETEAAKKKCRKLYNAEKITKAEYKAFRKEALRVVEQLEARIQELERKNAALERENAALRVGGTITVTTKDGDKIEGRGNTLNFSTKKRDITVKFSNS